MEKEGKKIKEDKRISTGIENFDELIEGGFDKNSVNLLVGSSGSGKSIFGIQFLIEGIKKNENCLYVTFEEQKAEFFENMKELEFDLAGLEKKEKLFFLEYTPKKVKSMLEEGGGAIENIILEKKIKRVVIDSITSFELLFKNEFEKRSSLLSLFSMLRKWDCTTVLIYQSDPNDKKINPNTLGFESDSLTILYFIRREEERKRYLEILKMRGTKHSTKIFEFAIEKRKGIVLSKKPFSGKFKF